MDANERLAIARNAMLEGDLGTARRILDVVLAHEPGNAEALALSRTIRAVESERAGIPSEALGDLRPDTRHLEDPVAFEDAFRAPTLPLGVALLGILDIASGGIGAFLGAVLLLGGITLGILVVPLGLLQLAAGIGLWRLRPWAWYFSVVLFPVGIAFNAFRAMEGDVGASVWGFLQTLALLYLIHVRGHFLASPARRGAPA